MKRRLALLLLLLLLPLSACGAQSGPSVTVYRVLAPYYRTSGALIQAETAVLSPTVGVLNSLVAAFNAPPGDPALQSPLPEGLIILGYRLNGDELRLELSPAYAALEGMERSLADCCMALSFLGVSGVTRVAVYSGGLELTPPMTADDFLTADDSVPG